MTLLLFTLLLVIVELQCLHNLHNLQLNKDLLSYSLSSNVLLIHRWTQNSTSTLKSLKGSINRWLVTETVITDVYRKLMALHMRRQYTKITEKQSWVESSRINISLSGLLGQWGGQGISGKAPRKQRHRAIGNVMVCSEISNWHVAREMGSFGGKRDDVAA